MRFDALLFDLDGTLVDSHHEICLALEQALLDLHIDLGMARVRTLVNGSPLEVIWAALEPHERATDAPYQAFADSYRRHYMRTLGHATTLFPGVLETLTELRRELPQLRFAVVSNKAAVSVMPLLQKLRLAHLFDVALGSGGTQFAPKPSPDLLRHASYQLACDAERCAMIGDTTFDLLAGQRAGMTTIAICHSVAERHLLAHAGADHVIDTFAELMPLVRVAR